MVDVPCHREAAFELAVVSAGTNARLELRIIRTVRGGLQDHIRIGHCDFWAEEDLSYSWQQWFSSNTRCFQHGSSNKPATLLPKIAHLAPQAVGRGVERKLGRSLV